MRAEVPFPTAPPYTAYVGNLSFDTAEPDLEDFFGGLGVSSPASCTCRTLPAR